MGDSNFLLWVLVILVGVAVFAPDTFESWTSSAKENLNLDSSAQTSVSSEVNLSINETPQTLRIASWNIQVFGVAKVSNETILSEIANTMAPFDIISIQEVRDSTGTALQTLNDALPGGKDEWGMVVSDRLGRTTSKEQYALFYRRDFIGPISHEVLPDPSDDFEREPYLTVFKAGDWKFSIISNHLKPDDVNTELVDLQILSLQQTGDVIVLGDLNADCSYYDEPHPNWWYWVIPDSADTTVSDTECTYDRLIINDGAEDKYTSSWGIVEITDPAVSDHNLVWAEFMI